MEDSNFREIQAQWATVRGRIRQKVGEAQFKSWIKILTLESFVEGKVVLSAPNNFVRTRIIEQYLNLIKSYWLVQNVKINDVEIIVSRKENNIKINPSTLSNMNVEKKDDLVLSISSDLDNRFTFSNFIVGKPNELAFAAARRVSESEDVPFNPLFLILEWD